jgi:predicted metalloprotease with PDZ domain
MRRILITLTLILTLVETASSQTESVYAANRISSDGVSINYELAIGEPNTGLYAVTMTIRGLDETVLRVAMPAWAPGAYRIEDYARNVENFSAVTADGRVLEWEKTDKQTWEIRKAPGDDVAVAYQVFSSGLTPAMADLAGPATFMYLEDHKHLPAELRYDVPAGWRIYTGLSGEEGVYRAPDYDVLIDAPAFIGSPRVVEFTDRGERYRLVFSDPDIRFDEAALVRDVRSIVAEAIDIFGSTPFDDYTFLFSVNPGPGSGGLEHLNSTRITVGRNDLTNENRYERFLYVVAHEFFHLWNVKRIRPEVLGPFDYSQEAYTRLLWVSEGITSYYGRLLLRRAGILSPEEYLESLSAQIGAFQSNPGRFLMSNEEASWNTWLSGDNAGNNSISYYTKGEIAGLLLDLELRTRSGSQRTLDDVMRYLMDNWAVRGVGIPEDGVLQALEAVSGSDFDDVYAELARGRGEPDYDRYLAPAGLELSSEAGETSLYMGVRIEPAQRSRPRIVSIVSDGPAARAGLARGDVLLSLNGRPVTMDSLTPELNSNSLGDEVQVVFQRDGREMEATLIPVENPQTRWELIEKDDATPAQREIRAAWLD